MPLLQCMSKDSQIYVNLTLSLIELNRRKLMNCNGNGDSWSKLSSDIESKVGMLWERVSQGQETREHSGWYWQLRLVLEQGPDSPSIRAVAIEHYEQGHNPRSIGTPMLNYSLHLSKL